MSCSFSPWLRRWWDALLVALLGAWMLFPHLDSALLEPDEARYAEIPRLMLQTGDWVTPRLQGKPYNDKPPLVYWFIASSYLCFGTSIQAARLVPAVFGWLTLLVLYAWTRRHLGRPPALLTSVALLTMLGFVAMTRMLLLDGVLTFFVLASLLAAHHALASGRSRGWWLVAAVLCGGGILTKGPVALVLVGPCLIALRWLQPSAVPMRFRDALAFGLVAVVVAAPWYVAMLLTNENFGVEFFLRHHLQRYLAPAHHERPFWFYLPALVLELMPWSFVALAAASQWRSWPGPVRLLGVFAAWCFIFFSLGRCKLPTYLLPMLPALAVLVGTQLQAFVTGTRPERGQRVAFAAALLVLLFILAFRDIAIHYTLDEGLPHVDLPAIASAGLLVVVLATVPVWRRLLPSGDRRRLVSWAAATAGAWCLTLWTCHDAIPEYADSASVVPACRRLARVAGEQGMPFVAHRNSWDAVSFMLGRGEMEVYSSKEGDSFLAWLRRHPRSMVWMREGDGRVSKLLSTLPGDLELENVFDLGKVHALVLRRKDDQRTAVRLAATSP